MNLYKYTEQELRCAISSSTSLRQVLIKLGVAPYGGNYEVLRKAIKFFSLDITHFAGQSTKKGIKLGINRSLSDYLSNKFSITSNSLRLRLLREGVFQHQCSRCLNTLWEKQKIPLELEHIDGNKHNNSIDNLQLLCPNCHALTSTYRGRNRKDIGILRKKCKKCGSLIPSKRVLCDLCFQAGFYKEIRVRNSYEERKTYSCIDCSIGIKSDAKRCISCYHKWSAIHLMNKNVKIQWPCDEELSTLVWTKSVSQLAADLGVSDKAVSKHCKKRDIPIPPRGYWAKLKASKI